MDNKHHNIKSTTHFYVPLIRANFFSKSKRKLLGCLKKILTFQKENAPEATLFYQDKKINSNTAKVKLELTFLALKPMTIITDGLIGGIILSDLFNAKNLLQKNSDQSSEITSRIALFLLHLKDGRPHLVAPAISQIQTEDLIHEEIEKFVAIYGNREPYSQWISANKNLTGLNM